MTTLLRKTLFYAAVAGTVTSTIYCGMVLVAAFRFGRRKRREDGAPATHLPPVSMLKPVHGTEPGMELSLESFFEQIYPGTLELLFCARHDDDEGLQLARRVAARYPHVPARMLTCGEPQFPNAKVWSLQTLVHEAAYDTLITSDADARVAADHVLRCVQELADGRTEIASCLYVGRTMGGLAAQLDAVGKSVEMSGGILVADLLEGTRFALGVTMVMRRGVWAEAGGFADLGHFYAEDFVLGQRLSEAGRGVRIASHVVRLMVLPQGWAASFRDQLRWMRSTRRSRPAGHLGTGLTFAMPFGLLGLVWGAASGRLPAGFLWLLAACANRWVMAGVVLWALRDEEAAFPTSIYPLRDLLGFAVWVASYFGSTVSYRGGQLEIGSDGRFLP